MISGQGYFKKLFQALGEGKIDLRACTFSIVYADASAVSALDDSDTGSEVFGDIPPGSLTHGPAVLAKHADHWNGNRLIKFENLIDGIPDLDGANNANDGSVVIKFISAGATDSKQYLVSFSTTADKLPIAQDGSPDSWIENAGGTLRVGSS